MHSRLLRLCSILLTVAMLCNMLPTSAFAQEVKVSAGDTAAEASSEDAYVVEEVEHQRTRFSKEFKLSNGLHMAVVYAEPVHYEKDGQWEEIDNTLKSTVRGTDTRYTNTADIWEVSLPRDLSKDAAVTVTKDGYTVSFRMSGEQRQSALVQGKERAEATKTVAQAKSSTAQLQQVDYTKAKEAVKYPQMVPQKLLSGLLYQEVYSNTDIRYDLSAGQLKESIIINRLDTAVTGYSYTLDTGSLIPVLRDDGSIDLVSPDSREVVMHMPAPYLIDSAEAVSRDVGVSLTQAGSVYTLTYSLPGAWLSASERAWPVILDPVIVAESNTGNILDAFVGTGAEEDYIHGTMYCGRNPLYGKTRSYIQYTNLPYLSSADVVVHAELSLLRHGGTDNTTTVEAHGVNGYWDSKTVTWNYQPSYNEQVEDYAQVGGNGRYSWEITDIVRDWYASSNNGVMLKSPDSVENSTAENWKKFYTVDYSMLAPETWPWLTITFRNNNGLESYWDYTTSTAGRAGTGYINNYTGNLVWVRGDMGFGGNRMPVSISHVYNANDAGNNIFGLGYGWRTNFNQRAYQWSVDGNYYVWEDSDGTAHYFYYDSDIGKYRDEDGLELTMEVSSSGRVITDKYGNRSYFDSSNRLYKQENNQAAKSSIQISYLDSGYRISRITDGAGRIYNFTYSNGLLNRISYTGTGSTELSYVTFSYSGSLLTSVTDKDGKTSNYSYTTNNLLSAVTDIDGYALNYGYNIVTAGKPARVATVNESHNGVSGGSLTIEYAHNQTTFTDVSGNVQIMQFNDWGNTVSVQDGEGRAQFAGYAHDGNSGGKGNQLTLSSKLQNTVGNILHSNSFENGTDWLSNSSYVSHTVTTEAAYMGSRSLKMTRSVTGRHAGIYAPYLNAAAGETYTFSAYVKTGSASAYLAWWDGSGTVEGEILKANSDWTRLEVTYTATTSKILTPHLLTDDAGTVYIDCVQVEKAPTASRYNLVDDGDFRYADSWSSSAGLTTLSAAAPELEGTVYQMNGDPTAVNRISQTVYVSGSGGDSFVLAGWAKGDSAPLRDNRQFAIIGTFNYTDGTKKTFTAQFNPDTDSTVNWQYSATAMVAEKAYSSITVEVAYDYNVNTVYFDGIQLFKEQFGTSYTYDANGNVTSVKDLQNQTTTYEYANNNLTKQTLPTGAALTYTYDSYHNVKTATTDLGVVYTFGYDSYGNNTSVSVGNGITAAASYANSGNTLSATTDALGNTTTYHYNADTNVLEWVKYPKDTDATKTNYTYDSMYRMATATVTTDTNTALSASYTYTNDLLTKIQAGSTVYSFSYGNFTLRSNVKVGVRTLANYSYTDRTHYLSTLDYGNGDKVQYTYDKQGRVTKETYEDGDTVTYKYDNSGALATVIDSATGRTTTYYYDFTDRMMKYVESGSGYSHSVGYTYDNINNLTALVETINGVTRTTGYTYDGDNRVTSVSTNGISESYSYDGYGRVTAKVTKNGSTTVLTEYYTYKTNASGQPTSQVATMRSVSAGRDVTYSYSYDSNGNITSVSDGTYTTTYAYDSANQLIRENNQAAGASWTYAYDNAGNILSKVRYAYTTGGLGSATSSIGYAYGDSVWGDLLMVWNGNTVISDTIGNILSDGAWTYTWEHGRELASMSGGGTTWSFAYDADGMRASRSNGSRTYNYVYNGSSLSQLTVDNHTLRFTYDASGSPLSVTYDGTEYYYVLNLQGDVAAILDGSGNTVVTYTYDAWGNILATTGSMSGTLGFYNPLRYRGYVYDTETGLYYLQSRYYNPGLGRFINADAFTSTGQGLLGNNMFAYCLNNPVMLVDSLGSQPIEAIDTNGDGEPDCYVYEYTYTVNYLFWSKTKKGYVYIYVGRTSGDFLETVQRPDKFNAASDLMAAYYISTDSNGNPNPVIYAYRADKIKKNCRSQIIECFQEFDQDFDTDWNRTDESLLIEWEGHHIYRIAKSAKNIDFDNNEEGMPLDYYHKKAWLRIKAMFD